MSPRWEEALPEVLANWGIEDPAWEPCGGGNINATFRVWSSARPQRRMILQRLNPIFGAEVHEDIAAVTGRLISKGVHTPVLVPCRSGEFYWAHGQLGVWRGLSEIEGVVYPRLESVEMARGAGRLLATFHGALADLDYAFKNRRVGVHDTPKHLAFLRETIRRGDPHPAAPEVGRLAEEILRRAEALPALTGSPERVVHGDPKAGNMVFSTDGRALALIDLDTVGRMPLSLELGDAFRSWCNPAGEDEIEPEFSLSFFEGALEGYAQGGSRLPVVDREILPSAVETIMLELAARFAADALNEAYFGWDPERFDAAWEHHLVRAKGQLALARSFASQRQLVERLVGELLIE